MLDGFWSAIDNNTIYMRVNKEDLSNPNYGSTDHPVPVFKVWGGR